MADKQAGKEAGVEKRVLSVSAAPVPFPSGSGKVQREPPPSTPEHKLPHGLEHQFADRPSVLDLSSAPLLPLPPSSSSAVVASAGSSMDSKHSKSYNTAERFFMNWVNGIGSPVSSVASADMFSCWFHRSNPAATSGDADPFQGQTRLKDNGSNFDEVYSFYILPELTSAMEAAYNIAQNNPEFENRTLRDWVFGEQKMLRDEKVGEVKLPIDKKEEEEEPAFVFDSSSQMSKGVLYFKQLVMQIMRMRTVTLGAASSSSSASSSSNNPFSRRGRYRYTRPTHASLLFDLGLTAHLMKNFANSCGCSFPLSK